MTDVRMGIYQHYKGPLYQVIGLAHDANSHDLFFKYDDPPADPRNAAYGPSYAALGDRTVVVYIALELVDGHTGPRLCVRTLEDFTALLHISDDSVCPGGDHCSHRFPRFNFIGAELTGRALAKRLEANGNA